MSKTKLSKRLAASLIAAATIGTSGVLTSLSYLPANAADTDNYAKLLQYSMYFYDGNMCGDDVDTESAFTWRSDCHTGDEITGGFHDAGDHVKFGLPAGYSASTLGWGYYEFKDSYDSLGLTDHLKQITNRFCEYFKDCTVLSGDTVTKLCYQIGRGGGSYDHGYWGPPETQEEIKGTREALWTTDSASDIAAEYAAALAWNYINFGNEEDLTYAKALYEFSTKYNALESDGPEGFYKTSYSDYYDDQAWAAGVLYLATGESSYKTFLNTFCNASGQGVSGNAGLQWGIYTNMCWDNVSMGAGILQAEITGDSSDWSKVTTYIDGKATSETEYYCDSSWGSARANCSVQMSALVATKHGQKDYSSWAKAQMGIILGDNSTGKNFVIGYDENSPTTAHHRAASGHAYTSEDEATPAWDAENHHTLVGALVGGPTSSDVSTYNDAVDDAVSNEVALDYNAVLVGAAAALYDTYGTGELDSTIEGTSGTKTTTATTAATTTTDNGTTTAVTGATTKSTNATTAAPTTTAVTATPSEGIEITGVSFEETIDLSKYSDIESIEVVCSGATSGSQIDYTLGSWEKSGTVTDSEASNGVYTISVDKDYSQITLHRYYNPDNVTLSKVIVHTKGSATTTAATTAATTKATAATTKATNATTAVTTKATAATTAATTKQASSGVYEIKPNQDVDYSALPTDDKMIGWTYEELGVPADATITKVEVDLSTVEDKLGTWQGAFGSSTTVEADGYWTQTGDMEQTFSGDTGTLVWNVDSDTASIIQTQYGGQVKVGFWWIDSNDFTIDAVRVYTDDASDTTTAAVTTAAPTTTTATKATTAVTTKATVATTTVDKDAFAIFASDTFVEPGQTYYPVDLTMQNPRDLLGISIAFKIDDEGEATAALLKGAYQSSEQSDTFVNMGTWTENPNEMVWAIPADGGKLASAEDIQADIDAGYPFFTAYYNIPDEATVKSIAEQYGLELKYDETEGYYYEFPLAFDHEKLNDSNGLALEAVDEHNNIIEDTVWVDGSIKVKVSDVTTTTTTTGTGTTTTTTTVTTTTATNATTTATNATTTATNATTTATNASTTATNATTGSATTTTAVTTGTGATTTDNSSTTTTTTLVPLYGDVNVNGQVTIIDVVLLNKAVAGVVTLSDQAFLNADCGNVDKVLDAHDVNALMQFLVGIVDELPGEAS